MQKILIADSSAVFSGALASKLKAEFQIAVCADGYAALELLPRYQPDILILNLMLPYMDGLTLLQQTPFQPRVILAITMHMSNYLEQAVYSLGIDYTLIAPTAEVVVRRLRDLLQQYRLPAESADLHSKASHHLKMLRIPTHLDGYRQLAAALPIFAENPQQLLTKELYPAVAGICGSKDSRAVEHSIRKAIQAAWRHRDIAIWRKYFSVRDICPTNKEFICRLAEILLSPSSFL